MSRPLCCLGSLPCSTRVAWYVSANWGIASALGLSDGLAVAEPVCQRVCGGNAGLDRFGSKCGLGCGSGTHGLHSRTFSPPPNAGFEPVVVNLIRFDLSSRSVSSVKSIVSTGTQVPRDLECLSALVSG